MSTRGIDIAWDRPTISQIKATGAEFVARYLSWDASKNLTAAEVRDYCAAGLGTVTVWETTATRALDGYAAGQADAHAAEQQRAAVGLPPTHVHHFAVDTDTDWATVKPYFDGAASVIGQRRTGAYGGLRVITGAYDAGYRYLWQTDAWSGGVWSPRATIRQTGGTCLAGQAGYDTAEALDFGQYPRPAVPKPPTPKPPVPAPVFLEDTVLAYLPPLPANATTDVPVEPAGTLADPKGGARNGPLWLCVAAQGADGTVSVSMRTAKGWSAAVEHPVTITGGKLVFSLPTDGTVDVVRVHPTVPLIGYLTGRQVA